MSKTGKTQAKSPADSRLRDLSSAQKAEGNSKKTEDNTKAAAEIKSTRSLLTGSQYLDKLRTLSEGKSDFKTLPGKPPKSDSSKKDLGGNPPQSSLPWWQRDPMLVDPYHHRSKPTQT